MDGGTNEYNITLKLELFGSNTLEDIFCYSISNVGPENNPDYVGQVSRILNRFAHPLWLCPGNIIVYFDDLNHK